MTARRIGIEISSTAVRIAVLAPKGTPPKLLGLAETRLPAGAVSDGGIVDRVAVKKAVEFCLARVGLRPSSLERAEAWLGVAGLRAITREVEMPPVPDAELDAALRLQAPDILPFPVDNAVLSARRIGDAVSEGGQARILLAAAHRDLIDPVVEVLEQCNIKLNGVGLASFALVRALGETGPDAPAAEAVVDIGAELTTVVVHERGEPCFVRTISGGGASATRAVARALDVPFPEAERMKLRLASTSGSATSAEVSEAMREGSTELLADIRNSVEYYSAGPGRPTIGRVVVTGGGALAPEIIDRLRAQLRCPVVTLSPFAKVHASVLRERVAELDPVAAVAVGMAMPRPAGQKAIDLLPAEVLLGRRVRSTEQAVFAAAGVVVIALAGVGALRYVQLHSARSAEARLQSSIQVLDRQIPKFDKVEQIRKTLLADQSIVVPIVTHEVNWPAVLEALRQGTPSSVSTSGFTGTASTTGTATTAAVGTSSAAPASSQIVATVNVSLSGTGYPAFQQWFALIGKAGMLAVMQYSGLTSGDKAVSFTAELGITGKVKSDRLSRYEVVHP